MKHLGRTAAILIGTLTLAHPPLALSSSFFKETDLVSDQPGHAATRDSSLLNPWGIVVTGRGGIRVADNHSGLSTAFDAQGAPVGDRVAIPPDADSSPTGLIWNPAGFIEGRSADLHGPRGLFVVATENGTLDAWSPGATTATEVARVDGAIFKGIALVHGREGPFYLATDFHDGAVLIFDSQFHPQTWAGAFRDTTIPEGYAPFGIRVLGGRVIVTYAKQGEGAQDDVAGAGFGYVDVFDQRGHLLRRLISQGALNAPWGLAVAPWGFGNLGGALLVGNFGDGHVNAYRFDTGEWVAALSDSMGQPIAIEGLWGLTFAGDVELGDNQGEDGQGGDDGHEATDEDSGDHTGGAGLRLYFTAGPGHENDGLLGFLSAAGDSTVALPGEGRSIRTPIPAPSLRITPQGANPARLAGGAGVALRVEGPAGAPLQLALYDASGRLVARLADGLPLASGSVVRWDGRDAAGVRVRAGTYFYRASAAGLSAGGRVVVLP